MVLHTIGDTSNSKFIIVVNRLLYRFIPQVLFIDKNSYLSFQCLKTISLNLS